MIHVFYGQDQIVKDQRISELKKKFFPAKESFIFDFDGLDASHLDARFLKERLSALPVVSKERLVIIKNAHKLGALHHKIIVSFASVPSAVVLVLDFEKIKAVAVETFIKDIKPFSKIQAFEKPKEINVFDLTQAISFRKQSEALKILSILLNRGEYPLQIMGGLVWFWRKSYAGYGEKYRKGLIYFQEADRRIKRSLTRPEHALEFLVVKLCSVFL